jgi:hypothetical protein
MSVDRRDLDELLVLPLQPAVSILMPAARGGPDTRQSPIRLKNLTREAARQLQAHGLEVEDAERLLAPVLSLGEDRAFWRRQDGGLAIYAAPNFFRWFMVNRTLRERVAVADHFLVTPLLPAVTLDRRFHVLALSQKNVRLIAATALEAHEVDLGDLPRSVSAALQLDTPDTQLWPYHVTDYKKEEALQFSTTSTGLSGHSSPIDRCRSCWPRWTISCRSIAKRTRIRRSSPKPSWATPMACRRKPSRRAPGSSCCVPTSRPSTRPPRSASSKSPAWVGAPPTSPPCWAPPMRGG